MPESENSRLLESLGADSAIREAAAEVLLAATQADSVVDFVSLALSRLRRALQASAAVWVRGLRGRWVAMGLAESHRDVPEELVASAVDAERVVEEGSLCAVPTRLGRDGQPPEVLVLEGPSCRDAGALQRLAAVLDSALSSVREQARNRRRVERLEAILEVAAGWRQTLEMDELLLEMAKASTRLLKAERASIFLWDRPNKMLVGRPALGVEGGELRIADDIGIVGQVVQTGEPRRVDADEDQKDIDRSIDKQLEFRTRSLLCVPLRSSVGELFGAFEMINKIDGNFSDEDQVALIELAAHAAVALENTQQYEHLLRVRNQMADQAAAEVRMIGDCPAMEALQSTVRRVADTELTVLIMGENGTGKEVVAQMIHYGSRRRNETLVAVNCAALTETLLESELFGHEKGAFTDARDTRVGKFELASGGTLFLDEIGDMSLGGQAKLLRVLEEKIVVRVGGSAPIHTDARVIAATNQNLAEMVRDKKFREDLYFRLNVVTLDMPPLRERGDDILILAEHFLRDFCVKARRRPPRFTSKAKKRLVGHAWPGNVRELRNMMERVAYLSPDDKLDAEDLDFILSPEDDSSGVLNLDMPLNDATKQFQSEYIRRHIDRVRGNMTDAARRLGLHRSNLYRKMRQLGMEDAAG